MKRKRIFTKYWTIASCDNTYECERWLDFQIAYDNYIELDTDFVTANSLFIKPVIVSRIVYLQDEEES